MYKAFHMGFNTSLFMRLTIDIFFLCYKNCSQPIIIEEITEKTVWDTKMITFLWDVKSKMAAIKIGLV